MKLITNVFLTLILTTFLLACHYHTEISYSPLENQDTEGYAIGCTMDHTDTDFLVVGIVLPRPKDAGVEYFKKMIKEQDNPKTKITDAKLKFVESGDTLVSKETSSLGNFMYKSPNLTKLIDNNEHLMLIVSLQDRDDSVTRQKTFLLTRHKNTYATGTFPHK